MPVDFWLVPVSVTASSSSWIQQGGLNNQIYSFPPRRFAGMGFPMVTGRYVPKPSRFRPLVADLAVVSDKRIY